MNKFALQGRLKSTGTAYLLWFFLGAHYAYLGKWLPQFLYWFTLAGLGVWWLIDLFRMSGLIERHNAKIYYEIERIEQREREEDHSRNMAMIAASRR